MTAELPSEFNHEAATALGKLVEVLSDPERRTGFRSDPVTVAAQFGSIPQRLIDRLAWLSDEELELLAQLNKTFTEENMYLDVSNPDFRTLMVL